MALSGTGKTAVKNEVTLDPATIGYATKTNAEITVLLNTKRSQSPVVNTKKKIMPTELVLKTMEQGKWEGIESAANDATHAVHVPALASQQLVKFYNIELNDIDTEHAQFISIIDGLVAGALLTTADRTAIYALADVEQLKTRGEIIGVDDELSIEEVADALL